MSHMIGWLGKAWHALLIVFVIWLVLGMIWQGWILPIWMNPRGFIQGVYIVGLDLYAVVRFIRLDEKYSRTIVANMGLWPRILQTAIVLGAPIAILLIGFFLFRGIWPDGIAFSLSPPSTDSGP